MATVLVVTEKPRVAEKLAQALSKSAKRKSAAQGANYFELERGRDKVLVAPAVGHVYTLAEKKKTSGYPVFDIEWVESSKQSAGSAFTKKYLDAIKKLSKQADEAVNACDYDVEGCLPEEEPVLIRTPAGVSLVPIGELVEGELKKRENVKSGEFEYASPSQLEVFSFSTSDFKTSFTPVLKAMRRPHAEPLLRIRLRRGRAVTVTRNHPLLVVGSDGLQVRRADQAKKGDFLPVAVGLDVPEGISAIDVITELVLRECSQDIYVHGWRKALDLMPAQIAKATGVRRGTALNWRFFDRMPLRHYLSLERNKGDRAKLELSSLRGKTRMPAILAADEKLGELIGYYLAEGCIDSGGFVGWYFSEKEENYVNDVKRTLQRIFKAETKKRLHRVVGSFGKGSCYEVGTKSKVLAILFQRIFGVGNDSHTKTIPGQFFGYSEGFRRGLVRGYIRGDGSLFTDSRDRLPHISAASVSRGLIRRLHLFLLTLGINSSIVNASPTTYLHIGTRKDVEKFIREIEPEEGVVLALPAASTDLQDAIPNVLLQASAAKSQSNFARNRRTQASNVLQMSPAARELFSGNVRYDEITAVEEVYRTPWVYDLETETHAFMHGGGVFSHNSVIGGNVIRFACKGLPSKRMLFSSLTEDELQEAFDGRGPLDASAIDAGEARHTLDWYWGINASRALMQSLRAAGRYKVMSIGRVQGPALAILAKREKEIAAFVPQAYWQIAAHAKDTEFLHEKERFFDESEANAVYEECKGQQHGTVASVNVRTFKQPPQPPFDLTTLQVEAYRNFGFSPSRTLELAQDLYEQALVSYPRTSSQKLPEKLGLPKIIQQLGQNPQYSALASQLVAAGRYKPREGAKEDSAHVAIYPTGVNPGRLSAEEAKLYDLVARRFLSCFAEPAERESMKVRLLLAGRHGFVAEGTRTLRKGWFDFYGPYVHLEEVQLPPFSQGEQAKIQKVEKREKQTQPPKRYTPASIVRELERQNLGTKSTRSAVVDTLYSRSYLADKKSIKVTAFGLSVHDALQKNVPEIMDEKLTRKFEEEMDSIQEGKFDKDKVVAEGRAALEKILEEFKEREEGIGKSLAAGLQKFERHEDVLGSCNLCKEGKIVIKKSKFGFFAACNKYPACKNTFPLPRNAKIVPKNAQCPECATPEVRVFRKGRRPFEMCLLPSCPTKANWASNNVKGGAVAAEGKQ